jgi:hypothetical protein
LLRIGFRLFETADGSFGVSAQRVKVRRMAHGPNIPPLFEGLRKAGMPEE